LYSIVDGEYFNLELGAKRNAKGVTARILTNPNNTKIFQESNKNQELNRQVKKLPENFSTLGTISIAGSKVVLWNTVHPRAVMIDDPVMAKVFTDIFESIWNRC
jgi:hypothetical protein